MMKKLLSIAVIVSCLAAAAQCGEITIVNPSFEDPFTGHENSALPDGWSVEGSSYGTELGPYDGEQCMFVGSYGEESATLYQLTDHTIAAGDEYELTFYAKFTWNSGNWPGEYQGNLYYDTGDGTRVSLGTAGATFDAGGYDPGQSYAWIEYEIELEILEGDAAIGSKIGFSFTNLTGGTEGWGSWTGCDLVSLQVVPEPTSLALLGVGAMSLIRRKRK